MHFQIRAFFLFIITLFFFPFQLWAEKEWNNNRLFPGSVFIENKGQLPSQLETIGKIHFGISSGNPILFGEKGICFYILNRKNYTAKEAEEILEGKNRNLRPAHERYKTVFMTWENANQNAIIRPEEKRGDYFTCVLQEGENFSGLQMNGYHRIVYENIYKGIDLVLQTKEDRDGFEYSFLLHPGADMREIQLHFSGDVKGKMKLDHNELTTKTSFGNITQKELTAYYTNGPSLPCEFTLSGNQIGFSIPENYDKSREIVIDPWVTTNLNSISNNRIGYDVDFDYSGNLFVYGGGDDLGLDFKLAKYTSTGTLAWTFLGVVPSVSWTTLGSGVDNYPGNFIVDKASGKSYVAQGFETNGTRMVRINANGSYDNFVSVANPSYRETWDMAFDCSTGEVFACGGGTNSNINFGIINTTSGNVTGTNITGLPGSSQDIVNAANDYTGNIYVLFAGPDAQIGNYIYMVNAARNGNNWAQPTGFLTVSEAMNKPFISMFSNGANLLAVNDHYLFYYDGARLKAIDKSTGLTVGNIFTINNGIELRQTGIAVDNCDNVYVGGTGFIVPFHFNGSSFIGKPPISLGAGLSNAAIHDIRYNFAENTLYVTGDNFAGVYTATESIACNSINVLATGSCSGSGQATVNTNLNGYTFEYLWFNSSGTIVRNYTTTNLSDSITGLTPGTYTIRVQVIGSCGGPASIDTLTIGSGGFTYTISSVNPDCSNPSNGSAIVSNISGGTPPFTYSWNTLPVQTTATATGLSTGSYTCIITDASGCSSSSTVSVVSPATFTVSSTHTDALCNGTATGTATTTVPATGGPYTYLWQPGGDTTASLTNVTAGTYTCRVTNADGCSSTTTAIISEPQPVVCLVSATPAAICPGEQTTLSASGAVSYLWSDGSQGETLTVSPNTSTTYSVTAADATGCTCSSSFSVTVYPSPVADFTGSSACFGIPVQFSNTSSIAGGGSLTYTWDFGDGTISSDRRPQHSFTSTGLQNISLIVTSSSNCRDTATNTVNVWPLPVADLTAAPVIGCPPLAVAFESRALSVDSITSYQWSFSNGQSSFSYQPSIVFKDPGKYDVSLEVTTINGCKDDTSYSDYIEVYETPVADFNYNPVNATELFPTVQFIDRSQDATSWYWSFGDSLNSFEREPEHTYTRAGQYWAMQIVTDENGCTDTITKIIDIEREYAIYIPNAFTPNGDGINEEFKVLGFNITAFSISIFNRWGVEIFSSTDMTKPWNGTYRESMSQEGVYNYLVTYKDIHNEDHRIKGRVNLIR